MVGQAGEQATLPRPIDCLQRLGDAQVQLGAAQNAQPVVQRAAHELVREAVGQRGEGQLLDHPAAHRRFEGVDPLELDGGRQAQDVELELGTGDGGQLEQVPGRGIQAGQTLADDLAHALRRRDLLQGPGQPQRTLLDRERLPLDERAPELAQQERVALGEVADRAGEPCVGRVDLAAARPANELPDVLLAEAAQVQAHDVVGAAQVGERLGELCGDVGLGVPERGEQEHAGLARRPREVAQEHERRGVRPVPVLEHEQQRLPASCAREEVGHRRVQAMTLGVGIGGDRRQQAVDAGGQIGHEPAQLATGAAEVRAEHVGVGTPHELIERLREGPVGGLHDGVACAVEHEHPFRGELVREFAHEAALARSGLAAHQRQPATLSHPARGERAQRR